MVFQKGVRSSDIKNQNRLARIFQQVNECQILDEITDNSLEVNISIKERSKCYNNRGVIESKISSSLGGYDPFDLFARHFVLYNYDTGGKKGIAKGLRIVNRNNPLGIIPSEISLMNQKQINEFLRKVETETGNNPSLHNWTPSSLNPKSKQRFKNFLEKDRNSDKVYEVGGLYGNDKNFASFLALVYSIGKVGYDEKWGATLETFYPKNAKPYLRTGLPFERLEDKTEFCIDPKTNNILQGYIDSNGRCASTYILEGNRFRKRYEKLQGLFSLI